METNAEERRWKVATRRTPEKTETGAPGALEITEEERRRMAQCCAFFEAEKYREAGPATIRSADVERARAQIDAVIEACGKADCPGDA